MFEHRTERLLPWPRFLLRLLGHLGIAATVVATALAAGVAGYHYLEGLAWVDAVLNAAMILGGMGPVDPLHTTRGKLFAAAYALFAGVVFLLVAGLLLAPIFHRLLHHFHLELEDEPGGRRGARGRR
jgi:hypothetical protein